MALLTILQYPQSPELTEVAQPIEAVTDEIRELAANMLETMYDAHGVGLAANQIGVLKRIIVMDVTEERNEPRVLINPKIVEQACELQEYEEGCLSLKGLYEKVKRPERVVVEYTDLEGQAQRLEADGLLAVCVQHEIDHLDGHVFIDHLSQLKKSRAQTKLQKLRRQERQK